MPETQYSDHRPAVENGTSGMLGVPPPAPLVPESGHKSKRSEKKERVRVSRACDRCKSKKIRCSGKKPCILCGKLELPCEFTAKYTRGRLPTIEGDTNHDVMQMSPEVSSLSRSPTIQGYGSSREPRMLNPPASVPARPESSILSSRNSPELEQTEGHYVGPSSGVTFLLRAKKRLHKIASLAPNSSIFTFGDMPLPQCDSSLFVLPPKEVTKVLLARYFDFGVPTHRFLHRPTVELWLEELYANLGVMSEGTGERGKRAVLLMIFAQAEEYMPQVKGAEDSSYRSARYFHAAEHQLRAETGEVRLTSVQARVQQCFYLLAESRINHCWSLFGTTAHLVLALGIHRKHRREALGKTNMIDLECRKRVFWCAYTLDCYLSAALGRPRTFHDDDIDQELPTLADDDDIEVAAIRPKTSKSQPIMLAPVYHCMLSQIISGILKDLYGIKPLRHELRASLAKKHADSLKRWRAGLENFLDVNVSLLTDLYRRQSNALKLAYAHACILVHRPFLLRCFDDLARQNQDRQGGQSGNPDMLSTDESVQECLKAAMSIVLVVNELNESGQFFRAFWFTHYYAFCAVVVLYIYIIQRRSAPRSTWKHYFDAAARCQMQISSSGGAKDSFAQRYSIVLEELRLEALRRADDVVKTSSASIGNSVIDRERHETEVAHTILRLADTRQPQNGLPPSSFQPINQQSSPNTLQSLEGRTSFTAFGSVPRNFEEYANSSTLGIGTSPLSLAGDITGWGEFDSFVIAGTGGFGMGVDLDNMPFANVGGLNDVGVDAQGWRFGTGGA